MSGTLLGSFFFLCAFPALSPQVQLSLLLPPETPHIPNPPNPHTPPIAPQPAPHASAKNPPSSHLRQPWDHWFGASTVWLWGDSLPLFLLSRWNLQTPGEPPRFAASARFSPCALTPFPHSDQHHPAPLFPCFSFCLSSSLALGLGLGVAFAAGFFMGLASPSLSDLLKAEEIEVRADFWLTRVFGGVSGRASSNLSFSAPLAPLA